MFDRGNIITAALVIAMFSPFGYIIWDHAQENCWFKDKGDIIQGKDGPMICDDLCIIWEAELNGEMIQHLQCDFKATPMMPIFAIEKDDAAPAEQEENL